ncbi:MAG: VWA domain-containing protein [Rhizobiales bacterium]|nr:VWA domain-containing protein [Hyphomicrobiales bacterium]
MFAVVTATVIFTVGAAIDYSRASQTRAQFQLALDAAALAVGLMPNSTPQGDSESRAAQVFDANYQGAGNWGSQINLTRTNSSVSLAITGEIQTSFLGIAHIPSIGFSAESEVVQGGGSIEIAMVLDNSGSMSGSKITALKTASHQLVDTLFENMPAGSTDLSFSLTPFATFVDIGEDNINQNWMDTQGLSSIHSENFSQPANRFDLYNNISNVQWEGCVEARPYPYDVRDDAPVTSVPDTLYVPSFAPDNPDNEYYSWEFANDYLDDNISGSYTTRQENVSKYNATVSASAGDYGTTYNIGPSFLCNQSELVPLTVSQTTIETGIDNMVARGTTNIVQGLVWGWRTLSPGEPFTEGRPYSNNLNQKILILLSDGQNYITARNNMNRSLYSAYGYVKENRLGTTSNSTSTVTAHMNMRMAEACSNIKAVGITIFTITFELDDDDTIDLMRNCATTPIHYFNSSNTSELNDVFAEIAVRLKLLRISR